MYSDDVLANPITAKNRQLEEENALLKEENKKLEEKLKVLKLFIDRWMGSR